MTKLNFTLNRRSFLATGASAMVMLAAPALALSGQTHEIDYLEGLAACQSQSKKGASRGVTVVDVTCLRAEVTLSSSLRSML